MISLCITELTNKSPSLRMKDIQRPGFDSPGQRISRVVRNSLISARILGSPVLAYSSFNLMEASQLPVMESCHPVHCRELVEGSQEWSIHTWSAQSAIVVMMKIATSFDVRCKSEAFLICFT